MTKQLYGWSSKTPSKKARPCEREQPSMLGKISKIKIRMGDGRGGGRERQRERTKYI